MKTRSAKSGNWPCEINFLPSNSLFPALRIYLPHSRIYVCSLRLFLSELRISLRPSPFYFSCSLSPSMAKNWVTKRPREEEDSEPGEFELSDSDVILALSDDDDSPAKVKKRVKLEDSNKDTIVRNTAIRKLKSAPKGSIGIAAVRALLAKSGSSSKSSRMQLRRRILDFGKLVEKLRTQKGKKTWYDWYLCLFICALHNQPQQASTRGASPPIKSKKTKVAVIIFLHKGVLTVRQLC